MLSHENAIVPVFLWRPKASRPLQVGSAVMLRYAGRTCLLTAAHVVDLRTDGKLCIPGRRGATEFAGGIRFNKLPLGKSRDDDPLDMGCLVPTEDEHSSLPEEYKPVAPQSIDLAGHVSPGDFCVVAGFPLSRAWVKHQNNEITSSRLHFVGIAFEHAQYVAHGYDPDVNILIEYHFDKAIYPEGDKANPPFPRGMSGGGVFRIERDVNGRPDSAVATLVGILHKFKAKRNVFVATKIGEVLKLLAERVPNSTHRHDET